MALNPPVLADRTPAPVTGEYMVLVRKDIEAEISLENKTKYKGKGKLFLTTVRMVFVNEKNNDMISFDVPIDLMTNEKFNQPIFGANYISGKVSPLYDLIPCPGSFKFWFMSGGTGTFLPMFYNIIEQIRKRRSSGHHGPDPRFVEYVANGNLQRVAYVDPDDPSVIFIEQPRAPAPSQNNVGYYFPSAPYEQPPPPQQVYSPYPNLANNPSGSYAAANSYGPQNLPPNQYPPAYQNLPSNQYPPAYQNPPVYQNPPINEYPPSNNPNQYPPSNTFNQYPPSNNPNQYPPSNNPNQYPPSNYPYLEPRNN